MAYLVLAVRLGFAFKILPGTAFGQIKSPGFPIKGRAGGWIRFQTESLRFGTALSWSEPRLIQFASELTHPKVELIQKNDGLTHKLAG